MMGYDAVNYGVWYDDGQFSRIALRHMADCQDLGVKRIVNWRMRPCSKAMLVIGDRLFSGDLNIPRESVFLSWKT